MNFIPVNPSSNSRTDGPFLVGCQFQAGVTPTSLYPLSDPPAHSVYADQLNTVSTNFFVSAAANVVAMRVFKDASDTATNRTAGIWDIATQTLLSQATSSGEPASGWITIPLPAPVPLTPNHPYQASVFAPSGVYVYTYNYFADAKVRGILNGYKAGTVPVIQWNGSYDYGPALQFTKSQPGNNATFWIDVVIDNVPGNDLIVDALGRWITPDYVVGQVHEVYLQDLAGNVLGQGAIDTTGKTPGSFVFQSLASPVRLTQGAKYWLMVAEPGGGDGWYSPIPVSTSPNVTLISAAYLNGLTPGLPTAYTADQSYGPPNFSYAIAGTAGPAPLAPLIMIPN
jgi:hypothetical protein